MKKLLIAALAGVMAMNIVACGNTNSSDATSDKTIIGGDPATWGPDLEETESDSVEIPSPITEYDSMDDVKAIAGFELIAPDQLDGYEGRNIALYNMDEDGYMIQIIYGDIEDEDSDTITVRKEEMKDDEAADISGVYTEYSSANNIDVSDLSVQIKGEGDMVYVTVWNDGAYDYSIYSENGLTQDAVSNLVSQIQ